MEYKVLIRLYTPEIEDTFDMYIPINKTVGEAAKLMNQIVCNLSPSYPMKERPSIYNRNTGMKYNENFLVRDTDIRNGTELIMII